MRLSFDIECYVNYFLLMFTNERQEVVFSAELHNDRIITVGSESRETELRKACLDLIQGRIPFTNGVPEIISFNGIKYDMPMLTAFVRGASNRQLKWLSDDLIVGRLMPWQFERKYQLEIPQANHIDLIEIPAGMHSLKFYGARLRVKKLQELPYEPSAFITTPMASNLFTYCINDNTINFAMFENLTKMINLRRDMSQEYGLQLMSKSEPQIGEAVIVSSAEAKLHRKIKAVKIKDLDLDFKYTPSSWIGFTTDEGNSIFEKTKQAVFKIDPKTGKVKLPTELNRQVPIGSRKYKFGIGGLHSVHDMGTFYSDAEYAVYQIDVRSYYPATIINGRFHPPQIPAEIFFGVDGVYEGLIAKRNKAKDRLDEIKILLKATPECKTILAEKAKCEAIIAGVKLACNGYYGKMGSHYAKKIYSPSTLIHTTLTGQLSLLMLIEQLELQGAQVLSANTDGITVKVLRTIQPNIDMLVKWWEDRTGYFMDYDHYKSAHYRDVNNYAVQYENGKVNGIGIFADEHIRHSPMNWVVRDAVFDYIKNKTKPSRFVHACTDVHLFIQLAKVSGSATKDGVEIGKVVRFYKSTESTTPILPKKANKAGIFSKVPKSDNGVPLMDYPDDGLLPADLDKQWYVAETYRQLCKIHILSEGTHTYYMDNGRAFFSELGENVDNVIGFDDFVKHIAIPKKDVKKYKIKAMA